MNDQPKRRHDKPTVRIQPDTHAALKLIAGGLDVTADWLANRLIKEGVLKIAKEGILLGVEANRED